MENQPHIHHELHSGCLSSLWAENNTQKGLKLVRFQLLQKALLFYLAGLSVCVCMYVQKYMCAYVYMCMLM